MLVANNVLKIKCERMVMLISMNFHTDTLFKRKENK